MACFLTSFAATTDRQNKTRPAKGQKAENPCNNVESNCLRSFCQGLLYFQDPMAAYSGRCYRSLHVLHGGPGRRVPQVQEERQCGGKLCGQNVISRCDHLQPESVQVSNSNCPAKIEWKIPNPYKTSLLRGEKKKKRKHIKHVRFPRVVLQKSIFVIQTVRHNEAIFPQR